MLAKHPIINRIKRKSKNNFQVSKERLHKNAVNATVKPTAGDRQPYRHPCPQVPAFRRAVLQARQRQAPAGMGVGKVAYSLQWTSLRLMSSLQNVPTLQF